MAALVVGNWKAHRTRAEAAALCAALPPPPPGVEVVVCPPFTALEAARAALPAGIGLGAQDVFWEDSGPFTGEITAPMLADAGCGHVIVGHSERRAHFGESDADAGRKLRACWRHGLVAVLCVGETLAQREAGQTGGVLRAQVAAALDGTAPAPLRLAYEPVWAIGTGRAADPADCASGLRAIREAAAAAWGPSAVPACLYGGSVTAANCSGFWREGEAEGALVGGASLDAPAFAAIYASLAGG